MSKADVFSVVGKSGRVPFWLPVSFVCFSGAVFLSPLTYADETALTPGKTQPHTTHLQVINSLRAENAKLQRQLRDLRHDMQVDLQLQRPDAMRESLGQTSTSTLAWALNDAGLLLAAEGQLAEARYLFERSLVMLEDIFQTPHPARGTVLQNLGEVMWRQRDPAALDRCREAVLVFAASLGTQHPRLAAALNTWGIVLGDMGRADHAIMAYELAVRIYDAQRGGDPMDVAAPLYNQGMLLLGQGRSVEAGPPLMRALVLLKDQNALESRMATVVLEALSMQLHAVGNQRRAHLCDVLLAQISHRRR